MKADVSQEPGVERALHGVGVTRGIAIAPVYALPTLQLVARTAGTPQEESLALRAAIGAAASVLENLATGVEQDAADILEFQLALLDDEDLLAPVYAAVDEGTPADAAWRNVMDAEIADYRMGEDPVFAARAADLADLRDRVLRQLCGLADRDAGPAIPSIVVAADLPPSRLLEFDMDKVAGIALSEGSATSHVVLLARALDIPMVTGLGEMGEVPDGPQAALDVEGGSLVFHPSAPTLAEFERMRSRDAQAEASARSYLTRPAVTGDGTRMAVCVNIDHTALLNNVDAGHCDGIGLARTEFLFQQGAPDEEKQLAVYNALLAWANGKPVTVRTLDAGGDKPVPGLTVPSENNPFLGLRGVRLSLAHPELLKIQLRALLRAAARGPLRVMVPMVTEPGEVQAVKTLLDEARTELSATQTAQGTISLGMMVEVPATALSLEAFDVDFYSLGTNDLIQYATASARDNAAVASLARGDHPGVVRLIEAAVATADALGREISVCGDMASDPVEACLLASLGVRSLSVAPAMLGTVKAALAAHGNEAS